MEDLTLSSSNYSAKGSQSEALGLNGRFLPQPSILPSLGEGWGWVSVSPSLGVIDEVASLVEE